VIAVRVAPAGIGRWDNEVPSAATSVGTTRMQKLDKAEEKEEIFMMAISGIGLD